MANMLSNKGFRKGWHPRCCVGSRAYGVSRMGPPGSGASGPRELLRDESLDDDLDALDHELGSFDDELGWLDDEFD